MDKKDKIIQKLSLDLDVERKKNTVLTKSLEHENSLWTSKATQDRSKRNPVTLNRIEFLDSVIQDARWLRDMAGTNAERFEYVLEMFKEAVVRDRQCPLFRDWDYDTAGNRCRLYTRHALLLYLVYENGGMSQGRLAAMAGTDQSTMSRYVGMVQKKLKGLLPTGDEISKRIRAAKTKKEVKEFMPGENGGTLIVDGFSTQVQRPRKNGVRRRMYSGKRKMFSINTILYANVNKLILGIGAAVQGSVHDITALRMRAPNFGRWTKSIKDPSTPKRDRINVDADAGFQGLQKDYPGANVRTPHKKSRCADLTNEEKDDNLDLSRERVAVENSICKVKQFGRMRGPYEATHADYGAPDGDEYTGVIGAYRDELDVITGLANLQTAWDDIVAGRGPIARIMQEKRRKLGLE